MGASSPLVLAIFFFSGAAGLVYEVLWTRQLSLIFGVTTYAVSTVLATFMGGLALGSYLLGRFADRSRNPLLVYAMLEVGIGLWALFIPTAFVLLRPAYVALHDLGLSYTAFSAGRAALAALVLLVPTTLMGGTFPVLMRAWATRRGDVGRSVGILYFINTGGAIVGVLLAGVYLLENFGLAGTTRIAASSSLVLGGLAALLARGSAPATARIETQSQAASDVSPAVAQLVLFCAGLSGFVSLAAEVLWSRGLLRFLHNSTYAFTAMLATFLLGISLGSALYTTFLATRRRPLVVFTGLQVGVGLGLAFAVRFFPWLRLVTGRASGDPVVHSFNQSLLMMFTRAGLILLPPAVFLGALFPLATAICARRGEALGTTVGRVYAVNTLGAILGSIGCAFVLIPYLGMWQTNQLLIALSMLGALAVVLAGVGGRARTLAGAFVGAAVLLVLVIPSRDVFRSTFLLWPNVDLVFYKEGPTDTVGVGEGSGQRMIVYEDHRGTASTGTYPFNFFFGHLPMLLHQGTPKRVLHICFGVGNSLSAVASHAELEQVDNVELSPHVLDAGPLFWSNDGVLAHPKVHTVIDDGRNFLLTTHEIYDVILLEPPEMFTAGVVNLYTREFYEQARRHLAPDGVMMTWMPTGNMALDDERQMFRAMWEVFPHATLWWQLHSGCGLMVGTPGPLRIDYQRLKAHMTEPRVQEDLALGGVNDVDHFLSFFVFDEAAFTEFVRDVPPTTDDRTVIDFTAPRFAGSGFGLGQFTAPVATPEGTSFGIVGQRQTYYLDQRRSVVPYLVNLGDDTPEAVGKRIADSVKLPLPVRPFLEADWRAMRAEGHASAK
jgi:spermidine synthase